MGMMAKAASKRMTATRAVPLRTGFPADLPWLPNEYVAIGALVRAACLSLGSQEVRSTAHRGYGSAFASTMASSLWCHASGFGDWSMTLGIGTATHEIAADWVLEARFKPYESLTVSTSHYLTRDGRLINEKTYERLRERLLDAATLGAPEAEQLETDLSSRALDVEQTWADEDPRPFAGQIRIRTSLSIDEALVELARTGFEMTQLEPDRWRWVLGLGDGLVELWVDHEEAATTLAGRIAVHESPSPLRMRIATSAARAWLRRAQSFLAQEDSEVSFDTPLFNGHAAS